MHELPKIVSFQSQNFFYKNPRTGFATIDQILQNIRLQEPRYNNFNEIPNQISRRHSFNSNSLMPGQQDLSILYNTPTPNPTPTPTPNLETMLMKRTNSIANQKQTPVKAMFRNSPKVNHQEYYLNLYGMPKMNETLNVNISNSNFSNYNAIENNRLEKTKTQYDFYDNNQVASVALTRRSSKKKKVTFNLIPTFIDDNEYKEEERKLTTFSFREPTSLYFNLEAEQVYSNNFSNANAKDQLQNNRKNLQSPSFRISNNQPIRRVNTPRFGIHHHSRSNYQNYINSDYNLDVASQSQKQMVRANSALSKYRSISNPNINTISLNQSNRINHIYNFQNNNQNNLNKIKNGSEMKTLSETFDYNEHYSTSKIIFQ